MYLLGTATSLHHFTPPKRSVGSGPAHIHVVVNIVMFIQRFFHVVCL